LAVRAKADAINFSLMLRANFSRDVENLSPCRKEALNSPPTLARVAGLGVRFRVGFST
jgi:hypothetical protein